MEKLAPYLFATVTVSIFALIQTINRKLALEEIEVFVLIVFSTFFIALMGFLGWIWVENPLDKIFQVKPEHWAWLIFIGFINAIAIWFMFQALLQITSAEFNLMNLLAPIFAAIFSFFLLSEKPTYHLLIGLFFMSIGLYFVLFKPKLF